MNVDCQVFLQDGMTVNECVTENEDGTYTIFINSHLCEQKRLKAYRHAIKHIDDSDFDKADVQEIEDAAHKKGGEGHG